MFLSGNCTGGTAFLSFVLHLCAKIGGVTVRDAKRLRGLEAENTELKPLLAESLLDAEALKVALGRKP